MTTDPLYLSMDELLALPAGQLIRATDDRDDVLGYFVAPPLAASCPRIREPLTMRPPSRSLYSKADPALAVMVPPDSTGKYRVATAEEQAAYNAAKQTPPPAAGPTEPTVYTKRKQLAELVGTGRVIYAQDSYDTVVGEVLAARKGECIRMRCVEQGSGVRRPSKAMIIPKRAILYRDATDEEVALYRAGYPANK
jgi:hypothetical protein